MAKNKKRKSSGAPSPKKPEQFGNHPLQGLKALQKPTTSSPRPAPGRSPSAPPPAPAPAPSLSAGELFEHALGLLDETASIYDLKFGEGKSQPNLPPLATPHNPFGDAGPPGPAPGTQRAPADMVYRHAEWAFEQEMASLDVQKVEGSPLRIPEPTRDANEVLKQHFEPDRRSLTKESIPKPATDDATKPTLAQRQLLERSKRLEQRGERLPELSLRGLTRGPALKTLQAFIDKQARGDARLVRVITGKGKQSQGKPVLKQDACDLLDGAAAPLIVAYVPEMSRDGDYGALIVQLRRLDP